MLLVIVLVVVLLCLGGGYPYYARPRLAATGLTDVLVLIIVLALVFWLFTAWPRGHVVP